MDALWKIARAAGTAATLAVTLLALPATAVAQRYPDHPIKLIVPVPPGGGVDILSRAIGARMQQSMGVPVVVENKAGASAAIGTEALAKAPPDGYTIMMGYSAHATNPIFATNLPYDTGKDFAAIAHVGYIPLILVVPANSPYHTVQELVAAAKAKPGSLQFASGGAGAGAHLSGELLKATAGIDIVHVPYKGNAPALNDTLGGQVTMMFDTINTALPHVKSGKLRGLAVSSATRNELAPDLPTVIEAAGIKDFVTGSWQGFLAAKGTPPEVLERLYVEIDKTTKIPEVAARLKELGAEPVLYKPAQSDTWRAREVENWAKVVKDTGIKLE